MGGKVSCNVDSHETAMSPALCGALYNLFPQNNVLSSCVDVCTNGLHSIDTEIKSDWDGHVDKCFIDQ